jgi:enoyl-CoA hydratase/carnithine racemase
VTDFRPGPLVLASGPDGDGVAVLTLNRPEKKNALSIGLREEAVAILSRLADDEALKVLVITGSGGCFSAGFDLREFAVTGREVDAVEALRLHLVTEITDPGGLTKRAGALAREVSRAPRGVLLRHKAKFTARSAISPGTPTLDL